jgi:hypothetical protein
MNSDTTYIYPETLRKKQRNPYGYTTGRYIEAPHPYYYMTAHKQGETCPEYINRVAERKANHDFYNPDTATGRRHREWSTSNSPVKGALDPQAEHFKFALKCWETLLGKWAEERAAS